MVAQTIPTPPIVIEPDVEPFMDDDMRRIFDIQIRVALDVADARGIPIERIRNRLFHSFEESDCHHIIFEVLIDADVDIAFPYWEALVNTVYDVAKKELSPEQIRLLDARVSEFVEWLRQFPSNP